MFQLQEFRIRDLIFIYLASSVITLAFFILFVISGLTVQENFIICLYLYAILVLAGIFLKINKLNINFKKVIFNYPQEKKVYLQIIGLLGVIYIFYVATLDIITIGFNVDLYNMSRNWSSDFEFIRIVPLILVWWVIFVPILQELTRVILLHRFTKKWNISVAIFATTFIIVLIGFEPLTFVQEFIPGVIMSLLYIQTQSIIIPMLSNIIIKFCSLIPLLLSDSFTELYKAGSMENLETIPSISIVFTILTTVFLFYYINVHWPNQNWGKTTYNVESGDGRMCDK